MTIEKEIRAVALLMIEPDMGKVEEMLSSLERSHPFVKIRYAEHNQYDPTCMEILYGLKRIGYVPAEEKRFVAPLLRERKYCEAEFLEVVRHEGHTPVIRFLIQVELDDVEPLRPGEEWKKWEYSFPTIPQIEDLCTVDYAGNLLKDILIRKVDDDSVSIEELLEVFTQASLFDMSVETTRLYDDLTLYMEFGRKANRQYIDTLQHASMIRRTDKVRSMFIGKWWPYFLKSEASNRLYKSFMTRVVAKYGAISDDIIKVEVELLNRELVLLPYSLYDDLEDIGVLWAKLFYTSISRESFIRFLSAMVLHTRLKQWKEDATPFVEKNVTKQYIQTFEKGSMAKLINM